MKDVNTELTEALRQYRHNDDNSPEVLNPEKGFVFAYDKEEVERLVAFLEAERDALADYGERLRAPAVELATTVENRDDLPLNKWALKCAHLVAQVHQAADKTPESSLVRSDEEKAVEAIESCSGLRPRDGRRVVARDIYEAIKAGKIPGVKFDQ